MTHENKLERIDLICESVSAWLENEDCILERSIERTVTEGLFPKHDVMYMLDQAERTITPKALSYWMDKIRRGEAKKSETESHSYSDPNPDSDPDLDSDPGMDLPALPNENRKILCLHAGNLPMVGLQDVIAALLSGAVYYGKLSVKDPWLLDGLLLMLQKRMPDQIGEWAVRLEDLNAINAGHVLFAGSQASVDRVIQRVNELGHAAKNARFLARTARFSIAWLDNDDLKSESERLSRELTEAMLRFEGRGCRSVAVVISGRGLSDVAGSLADAAGIFIRTNRPSFTSSSGANYWRSYLKSTGCDVFDMGGQIITDAPDLIGKQNVICWIKGDEGEVLRLAEKFGPQLQSVYVNADRNTIAAKITTRLVEIKGVRLEPLSEAQSPPIDWQPDGVDILSWLCESGLNG